MAKSSNKSGYVYLLGDWEKEKTYKIGVTTGKIENRIKKLQTGNSGEIYIVDYFYSECPFFVETWLHKCFCSDNIMNEWFQLELDEIKKFKELCEQFEKTYKINEEIKKNLR